MFHQDDERSLRNMLGLTGEFPEPLLVEYKIRKRMFCAANGSGSLGPIGLVDLVRSLGLSPPKQEEPTRINFDLLPRDTTKVAYFRFGSWCPGVYLGKGDSGKIYIRLDGEDEVREVRNRPDILRLELPPKPAETVLPAADVEWKELICFEPDVDEDVPPPEPPAGDVIPSVLESEPIGVPEPPQAIQTDFADPDDDETINWGAKAPGTIVWANDETEGAIEGKLSHVDEAGKVFVLVDGEETARPFDGEDVFLA